MVGGGQHAATAAAAAMPCRLLSRLRVCATACSAAPCAHRPPDTACPSSPSSRHSGASVVIPSEEGLLYMFGGTEVEPKVTDTTTGQVANDVWAYDMAAQGWEQVLFPASQLGCDLPAESQQGVTRPPARTGHKMVSRRRGAITCGGHGYAADGVTKTLIAAQVRSRLEIDGSVKREMQVDRMDCWWFTPGSPPRWDALKLNDTLKLNGAAGSGLLEADETAALIAAGPTPRYAHSMSYDTHADRLIVFGGQDSQGGLLDDCWALSEEPVETLVQVSENETGTVLEFAELEYQGTYRWTRCGPMATALGASTNTTSMKPQARYGHQSVYFNKNLYVVGGFAADGLRIAAKEDMWVLDLHQENGRWTQIMPATQTPPSRGFHALWRSGYKIVLHGGQGPSGTGFGAVLGDTWEFDLFSKEWHQKATSAAVPIMSHLSINPLEGGLGKATSFGGRDSDGNPSGRLYAFSPAKAADAWERVYPAGASPSRRTGHALVYDESSSRIMISFGMDSNGMLEDTWVLDLATRMWKCHYGSDPSCRHQAPNKIYQGPGRIAFPAQVQLGMHSFLYGGAKVEIKTCAEMNRGVQGNIAVAANVNDMWAMDTSRLSFLKVVLDETSAKPTATFLSSMSAAAEIDGFKRPLVMVGGADLSCASKTPPCQVPSPSSDIWIMDTARQESGGTNDKMAELDGSDDLIQIVLPTWCSRVKAMSVLWIDAWLMVVSTGKVREPLPLSR